MKFEIIFSESDFYGTLFVLVYIYLVGQYCLPLQPIMLEKEFQYYLQNQDELVKQYLGKFLVIKDQQVAGVYDTKQKAYDDATEKFDLGTFLIQHCLPGAISHTQTFHSQVIFA